MEEQGPITGFEQWYVDYEIDDRRDCLKFRDISEFGVEMWRRFDSFKREMDVRVGNYHVLEKLADGEVISPKPDLPNISSGETAGLVRRIARNLVQNTPNVDIISTFDDDQVKGIFSRHILLSKIIGSDTYSNDMQQNLFASTKTALTLGFDAVIPVLLQDASGSWYMKYDSIHYRDVFPEPGCRDVRQATEVFIRRYLTIGEVRALVRDNTAGWDINALKLLLQNKPPTRKRESVDKQTAKHGQVPEGYEVITWYSSSGDHFLTFEANNKLLLRIENNKHPLKLHPVHFLILEKDAQQPLGKSQVELLIGRQDFQDLMLNGAMKLWYRNINPSIIGYGSVNAVPNLSPGKYTQISNPNAKVEAFEVNTQTLMQYSSISEGNLGSMISLIGSADQQMAAQGGNANGMSATPQGVEAQIAMVDITTNNYQKAIESFFSHYCSYALTMYFQELKAVKKVQPSADARIQLMNAGLDPKALGKDNTLDVDFEDMAIEYYVRCVPGSLVEMEDDKQLRVLNQLFVPLSQAMPALAAVQDQEMVGQAVKAMRFIIGKQIELSGSSSAKDIGLIWDGKDEEVTKKQAEFNALEEQLNGLSSENEEMQLQNQAMMLQMQKQISMLTQNQQTLLEKLGVLSPTTGADPNSSQQGNSTEVATAPNVMPASA